MYRDILIIITLVMINICTIYAQAVPELKFDKSISPDTITVNKEGVSPEDITISLTITPPDQKRIDADVVFVVDCSASMYNADNEHLRDDAILDFINNLDNKRDRIAVIAFRDIPIVMTELSSNFEESKNLLKNLPPDQDGTDFDNAISAGIKILDDNPRTTTSPTSRSIIFLTDAVNETGGFNYKKSSIEYAAIKGYRIYTVGIKPHPQGIHILEEIANLTGAMYIYATDSKSLEPIYRDLSKIIPYKILATNVKIIDILPQYLKEPTDFDINVPEFEYIYQQRLQHAYDANILSKKNIWDKTKTIEWEWGTIPANSIPLTLSFKTKLQSPLDTDMVIDTNRSELNSVWIYNDANGVKHVVQIPPGGIKIIIEDSSWLNVIIAIIIGLAGVIGGYYLAKKSKEHPGNSANR